MLNYQDPETGNTAAHIAKFSNQNKIFEEEHKEELGKIQKRRDKRERNRLIAQGYEVDEEELKKDYGLMSDKRAVAFTLRDVQKKKPEERLTVVNGLVRVSV